MLKVERGRIAWADVAKGICILLVVLWHVLMKHYLQIDWHIGGQVRGLWGTLGEQLLPLRMPLFFAVSGFFAVRAVQRPWPALFRTKWRSSTTSMSSGWLFIPPYWPSCRTSAPSARTAR